MQYVLTIADQAERDLRDAYRWYEEIEESLGRRFQIQVEKSIQNMPTATSHITKIHITPRW